MIILTKLQYEDIIDHSCSELPNEACGLLGGRILGEDAIIEKVYRLQNIDESPKHFSMDIQEQFRTIADIRANGWELLGNFHSHPATPSRPSKEDIRLAFDSSLKYFILSLQNSEEPVLKCFHIAGGRVSEEKYDVVEVAFDSR